MGQAPQHQSSHRRIAQRFARRAAPLVILAQAATLPNPAEGAFSHPPAGQEPAQPVRPKGRPGAVGARRSPCGVYRCARVVS
jgi:hypothetical protein